MDISLQITGSCAAASPSGSFIAYACNGKIRISAVHAPDRFIEFRVRIAAKDVLSLSWSNDDAKISVLAAQQVEVIYVDNSKDRVRIDNGSGGLGRFVSADFIDFDQLLVIWEFGRAKLWNLSTGKAVELGELKTTCTGRNWQMRPAVKKTAGLPLATLSRPGAEDLLALHFPALNKSLSSIKTCSSDARFLSWSPDGRWLAILDATLATASAHFYTPDGHHFRSYPSIEEGGMVALGVRALVWSGDSQTVALTRYDSKVMFLNTRTFAPLAMIEHTTTIDQRPLEPERQAPIWQEYVSASGGRTFQRQQQPTSPPLSRTKPSTEPSELGVAEACFSCDGSFLATRDEQTLTTVWIWNMASLSVHAVIVQHSNVRRMRWHPSRLETLMVDCGEAIAYLFDASSSDPPQPCNLSASPPCTMTWLQTNPQAEPVILTTTKTSFRLCYPEGRPHERELDGHDGSPRPLQGQVAVEEGASQDEDSLFEVLSGRKPLPPKTEQSYTEQVVIEVGSDEADYSTRLDDTFVGKTKGLSRPPEAPFDPLDDSQIF